MDSETPRQHAMHRIRHAAERVIPVFDLRAHVPVDLAVSAVCFGLADLHGKRQDVSSISIRCITRAITASCLTRVLLLIGRSGIRSAVCLADSGLSTPVLFG